MRKYCLLALVFCALLPVLSYAQTEEEKGEFFFAAGFQNGFFGGRELPLLPGVLVDELSFLKLGAYWEKPKGPGSLALGLETGYSGGGFRLEHVFPLILSGAYTFSPAEFFSIGPSLKLGAYGVLNSEWFKIIPVVGARLEAELRYPGFPVSLYGTGGIDLFPRSMDLLPVAEVGLRFRRGALASPARNAAGGSGTGAAAGAAGTGAAGIAGAGQSGQASLSAGGAGTAAGASGAGVAGGSGTGAAGSTAAGAAGTAAAGVAGAGQSGQASVGAGTAAGASGAGGSGTAAAGVAGAGQSGQASGGTGTAAGASGTGTSAGAGGSGTAAAGVAGAGQSGQASGGTGVAAGAGTGTSAGAGAAGLAGGGAAIAGVGAAGLAAQTSPVVTAVNVTPSFTMVTKGQSQQFGATVSGNNNPAQTVTWAVLGGGSGTSINSNGRLNIAPNETASSLIVRATSTVDTSKSGTAAVAAMDPSSTLPTRSSAVPGAAAGTGAAAAGTGGQAGAGTGQGAAGAGTGAAAASGAAGTGTAVAGTGVAPVGTIHQMFFRAVYFEPDSAVLLEPSRLIIEGVGHQLQVDPSLQVVLRSYTAPFGTAEGREIVSESRKNFCRDYLVEHGIAPSRITTESWASERMPEYARGTDWETYRCVEFIVGN